MTGSAVGHDVALETSPIALRVWVQPTLARLSAGSAEDGPTTTDDGFMSNS